MSSNSYATIWNTDEEKKNLITLFEPDGFRGYHNNCEDTCTCRQTSRTCIRILAKSNINLKKKPVRLAFKTMLEFKANAKTLQELYFKHWPEKLGNFRDMMEWMFATRKSDSNDKLIRFITNRINYQTNNKEIQVSEFYKNYLENKKTTLNLIKTKLYDSGIVPRWSPGILWSLYSWAQMCDCSDRHKTNFPYFKSSTEWWISETEHSSFPEPWTGPRWFRILPEWIELDKSFTERPDKYTRSVKNYPIVLDCDFMPPSPTLHMRKYPLKSLNNTQSFNNCV